MRWCTSETIDAESPGASTILRIIKSRHILVWGHCMRIDIIPVNDESVLLTAAGPLTLTAQHPLVYVITTKAVDSQSLRSGSTVPPDQKERRVDVHRQGVRMFECPTKFPKFQVLALSAEQCSRVRFTGQRPTRRSACSCAVIMSNVLDLCVLSLVSGAQVSRFQV